MFSLRHAAIPTDVNKQSDVLLFVSQCDRPLDTDVQEDNNDIVI